MYEAMEIRIRTVHGGQSYAWMLYHISAHKIKREVAYGVSVTENAALLAAHRAHKAELERSK